MDALILAGGENKRLPVIKGFLEINGKRLIDCNADILKNIFGKVVISTNTPELYFYLGLPMIGDTLKNRGPMTGILSALKIPEISDIFVTACDMPFINVELVRYVMSKWDENWDAAIPVFDKMPQPLFGIYSKRIAHKMEFCIKSDIKSLRKFLHKINVLYIKEEDVRKIDREGRSFININTLADFEQVTVGDIKNFVSPGNNTGNILYCCKDINRRLYGHVVH